MEPTRTRDVPICISSATTSPASIGNVYIRIVLACWVTTIPYNLIPSHLSSVWNWTRSNQMNGPQRKAVSHKELWQKLKQKEFLITYKLVRFYRWTALWLYSFKHEMADKKMWTPWPGRTISRSYSRQAGNSPCETIMVWKFINSCTSVVLWNFYLWEKGASSCQAG